MTDAVAAQARFDAFCETFLRPLLAGGTVRVDRAIPPAMLSHFALARPSDLETEHAIRDALGASARGIARVPAAARPDRGALALALACHDLLAALDPTLDRWLGRRARARMIEWTDRFIELAGAPRTASEALARHAIVAPLFALTRRDVTVKNWAYTYRFFGRPIPPRVVAMPRVRFVRQEAARRSVQDMTDAVADAFDARRRASEIIERSPITALIAPEGWLGVGRGAACLAVLSDRALRSGIAHLLASTPAVAAERLGVLLLDLDRPASRALLAAAIETAIETHVVRALDRMAPALTLDVNSHLTVHRTYRSAYAFVALLPAALAHPARGAFVPHLAEPDAARVRSVAAALADLAGPDAVSAMVNVISHAASTPRITAAAEVASGSS